MFKPHFAFRRGEAGSQLDTLAEAIGAADGYIMLSPEYNHSMSPALVHLLNHFAASLFAFRPSAIATYSAGQWGGTRAAIGMRGFLGELGCIPVSAMIHVPKAHDHFDEDGNQRPDAEQVRWDSYFDRTLRQLFWWAEAARSARTNHGVPTAALNRDPSQRNLPTWHRVAPRPRKRLAYLFAFARSASTNLRNSVQVVAFCRASSPGGGLR